MAMNPGVPYNLLKEFYHRKVTVETKNGDTFKGFLFDAEENMSLSLNNVRVTFGDGKVCDMASVYIKGSRMRLINLPDSARDTLETLIKQQSFRGRGRGSRGGRRGAARRPTYNRYR